MPDEDEVEFDVENSQAQRRTELAREAIEDQARDLAEKAREHRGALIAAAVVLAGAVGALAWRRRS